MTDEQTRAVIAILVIVGFFAAVLAVMIGLVDIRDPTTAKVVGTVVGYITATLNPIIWRYFPKA